MTNRFRLELVSTNATSDDEATRQLRGFLKLALRVSRLRCVAVERVLTSSEPAADKNALDGVLEPPGRRSTAGEEVS